jgi:hypothetical protein
MKAIYAFSGKAGDAGCSTPGLQDVFRLLAKIKPLS